MRQRKKTESTLGTDNRSGNAFGSIAGSIVGQKSRRTKRPPTSPRRMHKLSEDFRATGAVETFTGPVDAARARARQVINECGIGRHVTIVEGWRELPNGLIEFTIRTAMRGS